MQELSRVEGDRSARSGASGGRVLAIVVGVAWLILGMPGGWGLLAGPSAFVAALVAPRFPRVAIALVGVPALLLALLWASNHRSRAPFEEFLVPVLFVTPALVAVSLLARRSSRDISAR